MARILLLASDRSQISGTDSPLREERLVDRISIPFESEDLLARIDALICVGRAVRRMMAESRGDHNPAAPHVESEGFFRRLGIQLSSVPGSRVTQGPMPLTQGWRPARCGLEDFLPQFRGGARRGWGIGVRPAAADTPKAATARSIRTKTGRRTIPGPGASPLAGNWNLRISFGFRFTHTEGENACPHGSSSTISPPRRTT